MFQTTRFSRPMLKSGRLLTIPLLALASFGAPALSAQVVCCPMPNYGPHQQPALDRGASAHHFNINGGSTGSMTAYLSLGRTLTAQWATSWPPEMVVTSPICIREPATGHIRSNKPRLADISLTSLNA